MKNLYKITENYAPTNFFPQEGGGEVEIPLGLDQQKVTSPREIDRTLWHRDGALDWNSIRNYV